MFGQDVLRAELGRRIAWAAAGPDSPRPEPSEPIGPEAADRDAPDISAVAVLRRFDPAVFARSAVQFALGLRGEQRVSWFRAFTRTIFLAGNPENLLERFPGDHVSPDRSAMWFAPAPDAATTGLRRLLKRFDHPAEPDLPAAVTLDVPAAGEEPGAGAGRRAVHSVQVATAGVTGAQYLVHVNHVLAEGVLTGLIRPGDRLVITHVPRLGVVPGPYSMMRAHADTADGSRLRAYAVLCTTGESERRQ
jgi:hypothetical protein